MALPALANWERTRIALHRAAQVIGAVRAAVAEPEPNWVHLGLLATPDGVTTGDLPHVGEVALDFKNLAVRYQPLEQPPGQDPVTLPLAQQTQGALADEVEQALAAAGHPVTLRRDKLTHTGAFAADAATAADYAQVLYPMADMLERFRASLPGGKSRLVVWPHGFDLAFLWFATEKQSEEAPHMAFGFSPYSAGIERPYLYSYASPAPAGMTKLALPPLTRWHTEGWTGTVTDYDALRQASDPIETAGSVLRNLYEKISPLVSE